MPVTNRILGENGLTKAHGLDFNFLIEATTTSPDPTYGYVKSANFVLSVVIAMSCTAALNSYIAKRD